MSMPPGFALVDKSKFFATLTTRAPMTLERADALYEAGYLLVSVEMVEGGSLFRSPQEWRITCAVLEKSIVSQEA